jgi:large subunit ribosomal protein L23
MISPEKIIKEKRVTEKSAMLEANLNQHVFEVYPQAKRTEVAEAVEKLYGVKVARVNILTVKGKNKRSRTVRGQYGKTSDIKKAVVTLKQGESIETV